MLKRIIVSCERLKKQQEELKTLKIFIHRIAFDLRKAQNKKISTFLLGNQREKI
jgi:hypothetical protein